MQEALQRAPEVLGRLHQGLSKALLGKPETVSRLVLAVLVGGHVLIEDVPGVGKTTAAKALARLVGRQGVPVEFRRIQFTPDLLPYDITGTDVFRPERGSFEFLPGPVFAQIVLGDEINRATPKVQSALLEVMEESQVTVGGVSRHVDPFFLVVATQNPLDKDGTYPLPEAQLDRFLMKISIGYPDPSAEKAVWLGDPAHHILDSLTPVVDAEEILILRSFSEKVFLAPRLLELMGAIVERTRTSKAVHLGLSPRSGVHWVKAVRAQALIHGRDFVIDQDVKDLALDLLAHRLTLKDPSLSPREFLSTILTEELALHES
jgi:MoxR-like ATPase